ncbi:MAG: hypothetical protein Q9227_004761 [Pyrenula ochraceoflavens]
MESKNTPNLAPAVGPELSKAARDDSKASRDSAVGQESTRKSDGTSRLSWRGSIVEYLTRRSSTVPDDVEALGESSNLGRTEETKFEEGNSVHEEDIPDTDKPVFERQSRRPSQAGPEPLELPTNPVARTSRQGSFFDTDSESSGEESAEDELSPTPAEITRASSVRVQRPNIVQHHTRDGSRLFHKFMNPSSPSSISRPALSPRSAKAQQILGHRITDLYELSPPAEEPSNGMEQVGNAKNTHASDPIDVSPTSHQAHFDSASNAGEETPPHSPPSPDFSYTPGSIKDVPTLPNNEEPFDTLPAQLAGLGVRIPQMHSGRIGVDGLRSNPVSPAEFSLADTLHRTLSSSSSNRKIKDLSRRVTIKPVDTIIANHVGSGAPRGVFRESIVSTPYPTRAASMEPQQKVQESPGNSLKAISESNRKLKNSLRKKPPGYRSFDTPSSEILVVNIAFARHPLDLITIRIVVDNRSTFDDEAFFKQLCSQYHHLLGPTRRFLIPRKLHYAEFSSANIAEVLHFDGRGFMAQFLRPRLGRKRKAWLNWLRSVQAHAVSNATPVGGPVRTRTDSQICKFTLQTSPRTADEVLNGPGREPVEESESSMHMPVDGTKNSPTATDTSGNVSPMTAKPFVSSRPEEKGFYATTEDTAYDSAPSPVPCITLHHALSLPRLLIAVMLAFLLAALATVLWVVLGVPGRNAAEGNPHGHGHKPKETWQDDAAKRVGVGLVLGGVVGAAGAVAVLSWIVAGRRML